MQLNQSVLRAITVLESFSPSGPALRLTDIVAKTKLPKGTAQHLVDTLTVGGILEKRPDGLYKIAPHLYAIGHLGIAEAGLEEIVSPALRRIVDESGETAHAAILDRRTPAAVFIAKLEPARAMRISSKVGQRAALHATAAGKLLLAENLDAIEPLLPERLAAFTDQTITSKDVLLLAAERIRGSGVAYNIEESERGIFGMAVPIRDRVGKVDAALSLAGPRSRIEAFGVCRAEDLLRATARQLAEARGHHLG